MALDKLDYANDVEDSEGAHLVDEYKQLHAAPLPPSQCECFSNKILNCKHCMISPSTGGSGQYCLHSTAEVQREAIVIE